jgi:proline iminopeptidase
LVLHGGPDFDHGYLLPELDLLSDSYRLVYYDQRGRGRSAANVRAEDVNLASDVADVERVRRHFGLEAPALLGHSWGAVLAMEYALRNPERVSRLVLANPAPASVSDFALLRKSYAARLGPEMARQEAMLASDAYRAGHPQAVTARYRIHFTPALARAEDFERLMARMAAGFIRQGKDGIVKAQAVEQQLMGETWAALQWDLLPGLRSLRVPTLVLAGDHDFIPIAISEHIVAAIPDAKLVTLAGCGHFAFLECPAEFRGAIDAFLADSPDRR